MDYCEPSGKRLGYWDVVSQDSTLDAGNHGNAGTSSSQASENVNKISMSLNTWKDRIYCYFCR